MYINLISMKLIILALVVLFASAEVLPFDNAAIEKIFQQKSSALFLFIGDETAQSAALDAFKEYDATTPEGIVLALSTKNDGHGLYDRLAEYLGVDVSATPKVLFFSEKQLKFRFDGSEITAQSLSSFVSRIASGQLKPFLKSAPIPEPNGQSVQVVVGLNFKEVVLDSDRQVLVKFYAPWCGHCKTLAAPYQEAAKQLANNPNVLLIKVDSTENEIEGVQVSGFPTLKYFRKDKTAEPLDFNGDRTAEGIVAWIRQHTEHEWVEPIAAAQEAQEEESNSQEL